MFSRIKIHLLVGNRVEVRSVSRATGFAPRWNVAIGRNFSLKNALALVLHNDLSSAGGLSTFPVHSDGSIALLGRTTSQLQSGGLVLQIDRVGFRVALRHHQQLTRMLLVYYVLLLDVQMRLSRGVFSLSQVDSTDFIR